MSLGGGVVPPGPEAPNGAEPYQVLQVAEKERQRNEQGEAEGGSLPLEAVTPIQGVFFGVSQDGAYSKVSKKADLLSWDGPGN